MEKYTLKTLKVRSEYVCYSDDENKENTILSHMSKKMTQYLNNGQSDPNIQILLGKINMQGNINK